MKNYVFATLGSLCWVGCCGLLCYGLGCGPMVAERPPEPPTRPFEEAVGHRIEAMRRGGPREADIIITLDDGSKLTINSKYSPTIKLYYPPESETDKKEAE